MINPPVAPLQIWWLKALFETISIFYRLEINQADKGGTRD
jgi:hypothetical protein